MRDQILDRLERYRLYIDSRAVCVLRSILEGYDNIFVVTTIDRRVGLVEIQATSGSIEDLSLILGSLKTEIGLRSTLELDKYASH